MKKGNRKPVQSSDNWHRWLKQVQKEIMLKRGENKSIPDIQDEILKDPFLRTIENNLIREEMRRNDIKIKLDKRLLR